jgi:hypothetical protein
MQRSSNGNSVEVENLVKRFEDLFVEAVRRDSANVGA